MMNAEPLIPKYGGFRKLKSFRAAQLVRDVTVAFCEAHTDARSRLHDQMVKSALTAMQRIADGSLAGQTSKEKELKLTTRAHASLEELRLAYQSCLQKSGLPLWDADDPRRVDLVARRPRVLDDVVQWAQEVGATATPPEVMANGALALIASTALLLDRQLKAQSIAIRREKSAAKRFTEQVEPLSPDEWES